MASLTKRATGIVQTGNGWTNINNAFDDDTNSYAYKSATTNSACHLNGFNFNLPSGSTIEKVEVGFKVSTSSNTGYFSGFLYLDSNGQQIKNQIFLNKVKQTTPTLYTLTVTADEIQDILDGYDIYDCSVLKYVNEGIRIRWVGGAANSSWVKAECRVYDTYVTVYYALPTFYLDLNGLLDGKSSGGISPYGTADVYINGSRVAQSVGDYYTVHEYGTTYEIKNIKANEGYQYDGVASGSLSGTLTSATNVVLKFSTKAQPPKFTSASVKYADRQVSANNKVPIKQGYILSVGIE